MEPLYLNTYKNGLFEEKIERLNKILYNGCQLCPRRCGTNRSKDLGFCGAKMRIVIASFGQHHGEETPISGHKGSGTIFFSNCNLKCVFCQNYDISIFGSGYEIDTKGLAGIMVQLQRNGSHNINLVTPTHYVPQIVEAIFLAIGNGLNIPIVYNCGGYENLRVIKLLAGIIDIYMPDLKFFSGGFSSKYCNAPDYWQNAACAIKEMYNQVGDLKCDNQGVAYRGLLVRHLVMPDLYEDSKKILYYIAEEISKDTYVNIMAQYRPEWKAKQIPELNTYIEQEKYLELINFAYRLGLNNIDYIKK
ncbi:radical SAM protein [Candidatus Dependentiae bacterium]|nr:radical SAM protein [Candidatus Dependentiae bacterium]